jgi:DNA-binding transcriptional MocR family regulator
MHPKESSQLLYLQIADRLRTMIAKGTYGVGDRVPSVRAFSQQLRTSPSTVVMAYRYLEAEGLLESRPQSGYYVRPVPIQPDGLHPNALKQAKAEPIPQEAIDLYLRILQETRRPDLLQFGAAIPNPALLPLERLDRCLSSAARSVRRTGPVYDFPPGCEQLRVQIARRNLQAGLEVSPDEIITTNGCLEALTLAFSAVCKPGDTVAVESPVYIGALQVLEHLSLKILEIPAHPVHGIDISTLRFALDHHTIKAVLVTPNFSNPTGSLMPDSHKAELVALLAQRQIPLIEDDIYGNLDHDDDRPRVAKSWDRQDQVILCSSFSKELAPGYRIGWIIPGRWHQAVLRLKTGLNVSTATIPQRAVAEFLAAGGYDQHLRRLRKTYRRFVCQTADAVERYFPRPTKILRPRGGHILWVELPRPFDAFGAYQLALESGISLTPGPLFTSRDDYRHHLRLNCAYWTPAAEGRFRQLGGLLSKTNRSTA